MSNQPDPLAENFRADVEAHAQLKCPSESDGISLQLISKKSLDASEHVLKTRRALFVTPVDQAGGAERVLATAARELSARPDWIVEIAVLAGTSTSFLLRSSGNAKVTYGRWGGRFGTEWILLPRVVRHRYDVVFSTHTRINAFLSLIRALGLLRCRRLVARESTVIADRFTGLKRRAYQFLYLLYSQQDLVIAQTRHMAREVTKMLPTAVQGRLAVVPNPVDVTVVRARAAESLSAELNAVLRAREHIVWCGRLIGVKRPLLAIEVLAELRAKHALDLGLLMIGSGPLEAAARARVKALGLDRDVKFAGHLENPYPAFAACRYGLLTSLHEGFPNVLLEMMAAGVPQIVTTPCCGDLDTLDGVKVAAHDACILAAAIAASALPRPSYEPVMRRHLPAVLVNALLAEG